MWFIKCWTQNWNCKIKEAKGFRRIFWLENIKFDDGPWRIIKSIKLTWIKWIDIIKFKADNIVIVEYGDKIFTYCVFTFGKSWS